MTPLCSLRCRLFPLTLVFLLTGCAQEEPDDTDAAAGAISPSQAQRSLTGNERAALLARARSSYDAASARTFVAARPKPRSEMDLDEEALPMFYAHSRTWSWPALRMLVLELVSPASSIGGEPSVIPKKDQLRFYDGSGAYVGRCYSLPDLEGLEGCTSAR